MRGAEPHHRSADKGKRNAKIKGCRRKGIILPAAAFLDAISDPSAPRCSISCRQRTGGQTVRPSSKGSPQSRRDLSPRAQRRTPLSERAGRQTADVPSLCGLCGEAEGEEEREEFFLWQGSPLPSPQAPTRLCRRLRCRWLRPGGLQGRCPGLPHLKNHHILYIKISLNTICSLE